MEDAKIVDLYWNRDQEAIAQTADKYGKYCTAIARNILGNTEDAKECVNDTYLQAWNAMPDARPTVLSTFLGKITRNLAFNRYKHTHASKRGGSEIPLILDELSECISKTQTVEEELEYRELIQAIDTFLDTLSPKKRSIFVCRYWYSDSISKIARQQGMKETAVSMTLSRIRNDLKKYLEKGGFHL